VSISLLHSSRQQRLLVSVIAGSLLYLLQVLPIVSAVLAPPEGYVPSWAIHNLDVAQYLTWAEAGRRTWFFSNFHAPWQTEAWMFQPLLSVIGRIALWTGQPTVWCYLLFHWVSVLVATYCLLAVLRTFCTRPREAQWAVFWTVFSLPLLLLVYPLRNLLPLPRGYFVLGMLTWGLETSDGLIRGGLDNSISLTCSTAVILAGVAMLGRFLQGESDRIYMGFCALLAVASFIHPFEAFLLIPLAFAALLIAKRLSICRIALPIVVAAIGMIPYALGLLHSDSLADAGGLLHWRMSSVFWVPMRFGIPAILATYLLLSRLYLAEPTDKFLACWFALCVVLAQVPGLPFALHLFNGYAVCTAMLLVRRYFSDSKLVGGLNRWPTLTRVVAASYALISAAALVQFYTQAWQDGSRVDPELLSAVEPIEQAALLRTIRELPPDGAVLAPLELAPWIATTLHPTFASHNYLSISFEEQRKEAESFYDLRSNEMERLHKIARHPFKYVVADRPNLLPSRKPDATLGRFQLFIFPENRLPRYPGAAALDINSQSRIGQTVYRIFRNWSGQPR
jgi:hypothetical protein